MAVPDRYARFARNRGRGMLSPADMVPAEFRPERHEDEGRVTRVTVTAEYADGTAKEWDAVEPLDFQVSPGLALNGPRSAGAALSVSFRANPRWNLRIWTGRNTFRAQVLDALHVLADATGRRVVPRPGLRSGVEAAVKVRAADGDGTCPQCGRTGTGGERTGGADDLQQRGGPGVHRPVAGAVLDDDSAVGTGSGTPAGDAETGAERTADGGDLRGEP